MGGDKGEAADTTLPGVSVGLFTAVLDHLMDHYGKRPADCNLVNRWIAALGDVEREYVRLAREDRAEESESTKGAK